MISSWLDDAYIYSFYSLELEIVKYLNQDLGYKPLPCDIRG